MYSTPNYNFKKTDCLKRIQKQIMRCESEYEYLFFLYDIQLESYMYDEIQNENINKDIWKNVQHHQLKIKKLSDIYHSKLKVRLLQLNYINSIPELQEFTDYKKYQIIYNENRLKYKLHRELLLKFKP